MWFWNGSGSRDRCVNFFCWEIRIVLHPKKRHTLYKILILLALKCRNVHFTAHEQVTYPSQNPDAFEFAWPARHFFVGKFGWYCTRESGIPVIRSGCIRFHLDFEVQEKATRSSQDTDFACSWLSNLQLLHTKKRHTSDKIRIWSNSRYFDFEIDPDRVTGVSLFL